MNKAIIPIIFGIVMISFVSALYAGESETFDLGFEIVNCSIINNTYDLEGLNLSWNNTNVTISTVQNYKPDNFIISCWVIKEKIVEEHIPRSRGGGGSCRPKKNFDWNCSEWSECVNGIQTRICKEYNNCRNTYGKPNETQGCLVEEPEEPGDLDLDEEEETEKNPYMYYGILIMLIVAFIGLLVWLYLIIKKEKKSTIKKI